MMNRRRTLAFFLSMIFLLLLMDYVLAQERGPISLNVGLTVEPWASWVIPINPITLTSTGDARSGLIRGVSFGSNNPDGFYIVAEMDNSGHLTNSQGTKLTNALKVKLPEMINAEPMAGTSVNGYSDLGIVNHLYSPNSYSGNVELVQEISPSDSSGAYAGTLSIFMTYSIGESNG